MAEEPTLTELTALITANYVANNSVSQADLPKLIQTLHGALSGLGEPEAPPVAERAAPAVSIKKSITPDYLIDLFTGKKMKSLKRHLRTTHNMTPDQYRAHWGLPADYPMVSPNYSASRSALAKSMGLGVGGRGRQAPEPVKAPVKAKRGRPPKAIDPSEDTFT